MKKKWKNGKRQENKRYKKINNNKEKQYTAVWTVIMIWLHIRI